MVKVMTQEKKDQIRDLERQKIILEDRLEFIGNKRKRDRTLRDLVPKQLSEGQILSENKIFNAKNNIIDKYVEDSFHSISIDSTVIKDTDLNHVKDLVFYINEGKKSKIKNIIINGNNNFPFKRISYCKKPNSSSFIFVKRQSSCPLTKNS